MKFEHILYQPGKVARVIFNRPQFLNALRMPLVGGDG
jgi:1,4-dihydroxy-2-naphthoyl-CoA synthase